MDKPWIKYITMENLPNEDLNIVAAVIGLETQHYLQRLLILKMFMTGQNSLA